MPIVVTCASCTAKLRAPDGAVGHKIKCPKCGTPILVPGASSAAAATVGKAVSQTAPAVKAAPSTKVGDKTAPAAKAPVKAAPAPKATVRAAPAPDGPTEAKTPSSDGLAWEQSDLLRHDEWVIKQKGFFVLNVMNRHFNLLAPKSKDVIGVADETASILILMLRALKLDKWLPTTVEIRDRPDGPLLLAIRKAVTPFALTTTIEIYDDRREKLGYFKTKIFSFFGGFWVYDAEDREIAEVKMKIGMPPRYVFHAKDGRELGWITSDSYAQIADAVKEKKAKVVMSMGRPGLQLKVHEAMVDQPQVKILMLATALALEFTRLGDKFLNGK